MLLRYRGRSGLTQRALAERVGVHRRSVQEWEIGVTYPSAERLEALLRVLLEAGGLTAGQQEAEARALWAAVQRDAPHTHAPFDATWFARLLAERARPPDAHTPAAASAPLEAPARLAERGTAERRQDWGEAPDTVDFVGRDDELLTLCTWVLDERCRLVALLGMGGIGKTTLTARVAQDVTGSFERVYWRSVRDAPPPAEWLATAIGFLSDQQLVPPASEAERIMAVLQLMRERRCLLVLDNVESLFEPGQDVGHYRVGLEGYGRLLQVVGEASHQSCLLLTSREAPPELARLSSKTGWIRALRLEGLSLAEGRALLADRELRGDDRAWADLIATYAGNSLALKMVGETIGELFGGDITAFIAYIKETYGTAVRSIRRVMEAQVERRLSPVELDVLRRLALEREPVALATLMLDLGPTLGRGVVLEAVEALRRRSLVERAETPGAAAFALQSVVLEYVTDRLVEAVADEIDSGQPVLLMEQPLIKAQAKDYVRQTQERLIGGPILQRLNDQHGERETEHRLLALLDGWRARRPEDQGYGPGNVVNLLRLLRGNLRGLELSRLAIRQAYLAEVDAQDASLSGAHLAEGVLADAFSLPVSLALSADGALLAAGTSGGEVWLWRVADRSLLLALRGEPGAVEGLALTADGRVVASGDAGGTVRLFDTSTGQLLAALQGHRSGVLGVALSADGQLVVSGDAVGTIHVWNTSTGRVLATLRGHSGGVWGLAVSADGQRVASGSGDGTVRVWDARTGAELAILECRSPVRAVAISSTGDVVASGSEDGDLRLWDANTGAILATLPAHASGVWSVALSSTAGSLPAPAAMRRCECGRSRPVRR